MNNVRFQNASISIIKEHDRIVLCYDIVTSGHHKCFQAILRDGDLLDHRLAGQSTDTLSPEVLWQREVHGCDEWVRWRPQTGGEGRI
jgi:hypothetical protein